MDIFESIYLREDKDLDFWLFVDDGVMVEDDHQKKQRSTAQPDSTQEEIKLLYMYV